MNAQDSPSRKSYLSSPQSSIASPPRGIPDYTSLFSNIVDNLNRDSDNYDLSSPSKSALASSNWSPVPHDQPLPTSPKSIGYGSYRSVFSNRNIPSIAELMTPSVEPETPLQSVVVSAPPPAYQSLFSPINSDSLHDYNETISISGRSDLSSASYATFSTIPGANTVNRLELPFPTVDEEASEQGSNSESQSEYSATQSRAQAETELAVTTSSPDEPTPVQETREHALRKLVSNLKVGPSTVPYGETIEEDFNRLDSLFETKLVKAEGDAVVIGKTNEDTVKEALIAVFDDTALQQPIGPPETMSDQPGPVQPTEKAISARTIPESVPSNKLTETSDLVAAMQDYENDDVSALHRDHETTHEAKLVTEDEPTATQNGNESVLGASQETDGADTVIRNATNNQDSTITSGIPETLVEDRQATAEILRTDDDIRVQVAEEKITPAEDAAKPEHVGEGMKVDELETVDDNVTAHQTIYADGRQQVSQVAVIVVETQTPDITGSALIHEHTEVLLKEPHRGDGEKLVQVELPDILNEVPSETIPRAVLNDENILTHEAPVEADAAIVSPSPAFVDEFVEPQLEQPTMIEEMRSSVIDTTMVLVSPRNAEERSPLISPASPPAENMSCASEDENEASEHVALTPTASFLPPSYLAPPRELSVSGVEEGSGTDGRSEWDDMISESGEDGDDEGPDYHQPPLTAGAATTSTWPTTTYQGPSSSTQGAGANPNYPMAVDAERIEAILQPTMSQITRLTQRIDGIEDRLTKVEALLSTKDEPREKVRYSSTAGSVQGSSIPMMEQLNHQVYGDTLERFYLRVGALVVGLSVMMGATSLARRGLIGS